MRKPKIWESEEYVDVWCCTLTAVMFSLGLISRKTGQTLWDRSSQELFDMMWRYKVDGNSNYIQGV
jgi:hypothetical protein